ncbi:hypothetical protein CR513_44330, partial [Mucuna pruriens]
IVSLPNKVCKSDLLYRASTTDGKIVSTSLEPNAKLTLVDDTPLDYPTLYRQLVGYGTPFHKLHFSVHLSLILLGYFELRQLLEDLGITSSTAIVLHCDNRSIIQIDIIHLVPLSSSDIFTKTHFPRYFQELVSKIKLTSTIPPGI